MSYIGETVHAYSGTPATEDQSAYEAISYDKIGNLISRGEIGDTHEDQTATLLETGRTKHNNGAKDGGTIAVMIDGEDFTDAGLAIIDTANGTQTEVTFKFDGPNQVRYLYGVVRNLRTMTGDASTKSGVQFEIAVNSAVTRVVAA